MFGRVTAIGSGAGIRRVALAGDGRVAAHDGEVHAIGRLAAGVAPSART